MTTKKPILPDLLPKNLRIVFCGTAPGRVSAERQQYYAHPQNKFWRTLYAAGLTPRLFDPGEFALLPRYGIGLTDIAKHVSGMDNQLPKGSLGKEASQALRARVLKASPKILAFTSLTGGRRVLGASATFGEHASPLGNTRIWVLPSPSPAAHWNWDESIWLSLGERARES